MCVRVCVFQLQKNAADDDGNDDKKINEIQHTRTATATATDTNPLIIYSMSTIIFFSVFCFCFDFHRFLHTHQGLSVLYLFLIFIVCFCFDLNIVEHVKNVSCILSYVSNWMTIDHWSSRNSHKNFISYREKNIISEYWPT